MFEKSSSVLDKLQQKKYKGISEKLELLAQLEEENPSPRSTLWMLHDQDQRFRDFACRCILKDRSKSMFQALLKEFQEANKKSQQTIQELIVRLNPEGLLPYLQKTIASPKEEERLTAIGILNQFPRATPILGILEEALNDPLEEIRYIALCKIAPVVASKHEIFLKVITLLHDESDRIRGKAVQALAKTNSPELVEHFFSRLPFETGETQKLIIDTLGLLSQNPDVNISQYLIPELASDHEISRKHAALLLAKIPNKKELLRQFLTYSRGVAVWLRERVFETMGTISESIADAVLEFFDEEDLLLRIDSMFLGAYLRDRRIIPKVAKILESNYDWWIKISAVDILGKLKAVEVVPILEKYRDDPDLRLSIVSAYGELRDPSALDFLVQALEDKSRSIRLESIRSLGKLDHPRVLAILEDIALNTTDWTMRQEATKLLEEKGQGVKAVTQQEEVLDSEKIMKELEELQSSMTEARAQKANLYAASGEEKTENASQENEMYPSSQGEEEKNQILPTELPKLEPAAEREVVFSKISKETRKETAPEMTLPEEDMYGGNLTDNLPDLIYAPPSEPKANSSLTSTSVVPPLGKNAEAVGTTPNAVAGTPAASPLASGKVPQPSPFVFPPLMQQSAPRKNPPVTPMASPAGSTMMGQGGNPTQPQTLSDVNKANIPGQPFAPQPGFAPGQPFAPQPGFAPGQPFAPQPGFAPQPFGQPFSKQGFVPGQPFAPQGFPPQPFAPQGFPPQQPGFPPQQPLNQPPVTGMFPRMPGPNMQQPGPMSKVPMANPPVGMPPAPGPQTNTQKFTAVPNPSVPTNPSLASTTPVAAGGAQSVASTAAPTPIPSLAPLTPPGPLRPPSATQGQQTTSTAAPLPPMSPLKPPAKPSMAAPETPLSPVVPSSLPGAIDTPPAPVGLVPSASIQETVRTKSNDMLKKFREHIKTGRIKMMETKEAQEKKSAGETAVPPANP